VGQPDLNMVIDRLQAYAEAGADCLYAPGIRSKEQISAVVKAVHPKPVNLLLGWPGLSVADFRVAPRDGGGAQRTARDHDRGRSKPPRRRP